MQGHNMGIGKLLAQNKKARHEYFIEETFEAGVVLTGTEVKSMRLGKVSLNEAYAEVKDAEVWIVQMHISPYEMGNRFNPDPLRRRKLLLHKREIKKLIGYTTQKGYTLIPLKAYLNDKGLVKVELSVAKGKKLYDKRGDAAKADAKRDIERALRDRSRGE